MYSSTCALLYFQTLLVNLQLQDDCLCLAETLVYVLSSHCRSLLMVVQLLVVIDHFALYAGLQASLRVEQLTCISSKLALLLPCSSRGVLESHNLGVAIDTLLPLSHPYLGFGVFVFSSQSLNHPTQLHNFILCVTQAVVFASGFSQFLILRREKTQ